MDPLIVILLMANLSIWTVLTMVVIRDWHRFGPTDFMAFTKRHPSAWYGYIACTGATWGCTLGVLARYLSSR